MFNQKINFSHEKIVTNKQYIKYLMEFHQTQRKLITIIIERAIRMG